MDRFGLEKKMAKELGVPASHVCVVGSTLICGGGKDMDFLCLLPGPVGDDGLAKFGFSPDTEISYESPLRSYRRDGQNLIVTTDSRFFFAEIAIANAAKIFAENPSGKSHRPWNMASRDDRILFHGEVREAILWRLATEDPFL